MSSNPPTASRPPGRYAIRIQGHLDRRWSDRLDGLAFTHEADGTTLLSGPIADQPALHGMLNRIRDLGVPVVSVCRVDEAPASNASARLMRAVVQDRYGEADALELRAIGRPAIGAGEVLVRVRAAGVDAGVWHLMSGRPYLLRLMGFGLRRPKTRCSVWTWPAASRRWVGT